MREPLTWLSHKALEEGHRDEEEKDDEEDCATDNALWLRPSAKTHYQFSDIKLQCILQLHNVFK